MPALSDYTAGTITLTNNSTAFTGTGTAWQAADFREGDVIFQVAGQTQWTAVVQTITSNTAGTLVRPWGGATGTYAYRMRYMADGARVTAQARNLIELLGSGNLQAEAGLTGAADTLSYYTGPAAKALTPLTPFARTLLDDANAAAFYATLGQVPNAQIRNDLTPDKAFRRGNILGTVSQSGGVPTDAIIERGSNANGEYVRFADGTQICTSPPMVVDITTVTGSVFRSVETAWPLPASFASAAYTASGGVVGNAQTHWINAKAQSATEAGFCGFAPASVTGRPFRLFAVGKWF